MTEPTTLAGGHPVVPAPSELRELPLSDEGYDREKVEEAFDAFRRQIAALQAEVYELKTLSRGAEPLPGDAARAETLRLVQAATELAQAIEQDARETAARQLALLEEELAARRRELDERGAVIEHERRQILDAAQAEASALLTEAERRVAERLAHAEAQAEQILEQAHLQAVELRASAQGDVERTGEEARAGAGEAVPAAPDEEPSAAPVLTFRAPPLSPEDLAANASGPFRLVPVSDDY